MTPEEQVRRAQRAELLLNDDLFKEAIKKLRDEALDQFKTAQDNTEFLKARALYDTTETFANVFINIIRGGNLRCARSRTRRRGRSRPNISGQHTHFDSRLRAVFC